MSKTESYLKDSQNLLQKCHNLDIKQENVFLYSMDFDSLYTSMNIKDVFNLLSDFMVTNKDNAFIDSVAFNQILSLIFDNNIFVYKNTFYVQINGIAMGCICGPSVANLFVFILERKWLHINKPLFYGRFIDDICLITHTKLDENSFKQNFLNLKLNIDTGPGINFLDLIIKFDSITRKRIYSFYNDYLYFTRKLIEVISIILL